MVKELEGIKTVWPDEMREEEAAQYAIHAKEKFGNRVKGLELVIPEDDKNDVELHYTLEFVPFSRLRRITGYLVGSLGRWNDAKRAEEHDRVKHGVN